jgi:hypothetical protein
MSASSLPSEIEATATEQGVCYHLPRRPLGQGRIAALIVILVGLFFVVMPAFLIGVEPVKDWVDVVFSVVPIVGSVVFMAAGLFFAGFGLLMNFGRCEIEVNDGELVTFDGIGSLGVRRRRDVGTLRRLVVEHRPATHNGKPVKTGPLAELAAIKAEFEEGKPFWVAIGYPRGWLTPLAEHLAEQCRLSTEPGIATTARPPIEVAQVSVLHPEFVELPEQPCDSKVILERSASVILHVPAAGLFGRGGGGCLCCSGIFCCAIMLVGTVAMLFGTPDPNPGNLDIRIAWVIFAVFWAIGIGLLVGAVHMARRQAVLAVVEDTLLVMQTGLFGSRRWEWKRHELSDIIAGKSNVSVNDEPVIELQIFPIEGKHVGVLIGRGKDELRWMATVLRRALVLPKSGTALFGQVTQTASAKE